MSELISKIEKKTRSAFELIRSRQLELAEISGHLRGILREIMAEIRAAHDAGIGGIIVGQARSKLIDVVIDELFQISQSLLGIHEKNQAKKEAGVCLIAVGGYGRGLLNPGSDIDILFLTQHESKKMPEITTKSIESVLYPLWDSGLKTGHASRDIPTCLSHAKEDNHFFTALLDARILAGNEKLFAALQKKMEKLFQKQQQVFLQKRIKDIRARHQKYSDTVFLQEPHLKDSPGGLRDFHNLLWISHVLGGAKSLAEIAKIGVLSTHAGHELDQAHEFLHQVRNELHFQAGRASDLLTLQMQGVVSTQLLYAQKTVLRRTEAFMRDYFQHTRTVNDLMVSVFEKFQIEFESKPSTMMTLLPFRRRREEIVDGFRIRNGVLSLTKPTVFKEDSGRLMRVFQLCQTHGLDLPPELRDQIKNSLELIDKEFRYNKSNRQTFQAILERKGSVARVLRMMHRVGVLGRWLPEFGAMDCLVQHEFFHIYTADEHTLRCIEQLDELISSQNPEVVFYQKLLLDIEDAYALYLALILHDSGRAENVREHTDGSAMLASRVCSRLQISGQRRKWIMFLVDHHLTFWRFATTRNIDDESVIEEFAKLIQTRPRLDALLLFTYADSRGTNKQAWSAWKESLMLQLHKSTARYLESGSSVFQQMFVEDRNAIFQLVSLRLKEKFDKEIERHFSLMPPRYFRFRDADSVVVHIRTVAAFQRTAQGISSESEIQWLDFPEKGYTEFIIAAKNRPYFIERVCCALASQQINILSADIFTRSDDIVLDILRICTTDYQPVIAEKTRLRVRETLKELNSAASYDPAKYLKKRLNLLRPEVVGMPFPVRAEVRNDLSPQYTAIDIQARDRIGLLHDVFRIIGDLGLDTIHARISTERGAALDTIYIATLDGKKVLDSQLIAEIEARLGKILEEGV